MQIVIDIPENIYQRVVVAPRCCTDLDAFRDRNMFVKALQTGTPLPKGHGELIDRSKIEYLKAIHDAIHGHITWSDATARIKYSAPTIIEADKKNR